MTATLEGLRQQRDTANAALTETKVAPASEEQLCASFAKQKAPLEQRLHELAQLIQQRRTENASFLQRKAQAEAEIEDSRRHMERLALNQCSSRRFVPERVWSWAGGGEAGEEV